MDDKNFVVNCSGEATSTVNGIKAYGISTTEVSEKYQGETYQKRRFRINVEKDNLYFVNLEYYTQNCESFSRVFPYKRP
jgi:hypothetical protein